MVYESKVTQIGEDVELFLEEKMLVLFNDSVPEELASIAVIHEQKEMTSDVVVGDYLVLDSNKYEILSVGSKANETLHELGHCTIKFGLPSADDLPGVIVVEDTVQPELKIGTAIKFERN